MTAVIPDLVSERSEAESVGNPGLNVATGATVHRQRSDAVPSRYVVDKKCPSLAISSIERR